MSHKKNKNKIIPREIYVDALKTKRDGSVVSFVFQVLLLYIGLIGFLYSVATSVKMTVGLPTIMLIAFPCLLISSLFTINKKIYIPFISTVAASILFVAMFFRDLLNYIFDSFEFCYNLTIQIVVDEGYDNYASSMTKDISEIIADPELTSGHFYCVIIVLSIIFSIIFSSALIKRSLVWVCAVPCFLVLTPSLYFGAVPDGPAFAIFISGIVGCYIESIAYSVYKNSNSINKSKSKKKSNIGHLLGSSINGFVVACTVMVVSLTVSNVVYSHDVLRLDTIREIIDETAMKLMNKLFYKQFESSDGAIGGLIEGDVLELNPPNFRDLPVMSVTTKTNSTLYLRGWIGKDVVDGGWGVLNDNDTDLYFSKVGADFKPYRQMHDYFNVVNNSVTTSDGPDTTLKHGFVYDTIKVKSHFSKSMMMFVPVSGIDDEVIGKYRGITVVGDTIYFFKEKRPRGNTYTINAALQVFSDRDFYLKFKENQDNYLFMAKLVGDKENLNEEEKFMHDERLYSGYVRETYMTLPENTGFLKQLGEEITSSYITDFDKALAVERYFKTEYTYAKNFTTVEGGVVDRVRYMINSSKTGYCTFFASAMTLMMRELGVPARYVIGYHSMAVSDTGESKYIREISDRNYHAWVEVYFDGIGWLTFDPTPGSGGNTLIRDYDYLDDPLEDNTEEYIPPEQQQQAQQPAPEEEEPDNVGNEMPIPDKTIPTWLKVFLIVMGIVIFLFASCASVIMLITQNFNNYYNGLINLDPTTMTRTVYPHILRLLGALGYRPEPGELLSEFAKRVDEKFVLSVSLTSIMGALEMSQFSNNKIDEESARLINEYFNKLSDSVFYSLNIFQKYYYMLTIKKKSY